MEQKKSMWWEEAGVPIESIHKQMPHLSFVGTVAHKKLNTGNVLITASSRGMGASEGFRCVYRFNPRTRTAELVYFKSNNIAKIGEESLMDRLNFNHYVNLEQGFSMLSKLMGLKLQEVEKRFTEIEALGCNQILLNQSGEDRPRIVISFGRENELPSVRFMYDYYIDTDELELVHTNDGQGKVWSKWSEKKPE